MVLKAQGSTGSLKRATSMRFCRQLVCKNAGLSSQAHCSCAVALQWVLEPLLLATVLLSVTVFPARCCSAPCLHSVAMMENGKRGCSHGRWKPCIRSIN